MVVVVVFRVNQELSLGKIDLLRNFGLNCCCTNKLKKKSKEKRSEEPLRLQLVLFFRLSSACLPLVLCDSFRLRIQPLLYLTIILNVHFDGTI